MLLELSQILRYQLYDCSRKAVLLKAEIDFLTNYLALEQVYSHRFQYMVSAEGEVHRIFVPPLLFLPFVQQAVIQIYSQPVFGSIDLNFHVNGNEIQLFALLIMGIYCIRMTFRKSGRDWNCYMETIIPYLLLKGQLC